MFHFVKPLKIEISKENETYHAVMCGRTPIRGFGKSKEEALAEIKRKVIDDLSHEKSSIRPLLRPSAYVDVVLGFYNARWGSGYEAGYFDPEKTEEGSRHVFLNWDDADANKEQFALVTHFLYQLELCALKNEKIFEKYLKDGISQSEFVDSILKVHDPDIEGVAETLYRRTAKDAETKSPCEANIPAEIRIGASKDYILDALAIKAYEILTEKSATEI